MVNASRNGAMSVPVVGSARPGCVVGVAGPCQVVVVVGALLVGEMGGIVVGVPEVGGGSVVVDDVVDAAAANRTWTRASPVSPEASLTV